MSHRKEPPLSGVNKEIEMVVPSEQFRIKAEITSGEGLLDDTSVQWSAVKPCSSNSLGPEKKFHSKD
jgi:hypothetical protein